MLRPSEPAASLVTDVHGSVMKGVGRLFLAVFRPALRLLLVWTVIACRWQRPRKAFTRNGASDASGYARGDRAIFPGSRRKRKTRQRRGGEARSEHEFDGWSDEHGVVSPKAEDTTIGFGRSRPVKPFIPNCSIGAFGNRPPARPIHQSQTRTRWMT